MRFARLALAVMAVAVLCSCSDGKEPSAAQSTSTSLSVDPSYWTEERMRAAKPVDNTVGPSVEQAIVIGALLLVGIAAVVVVLWRRRSRSDG